MKGLCFLFLKQNVNEGSVLTYNYVQISALFSFSFANKLFISLFDVDPEGNGRQRHSKITATVGLVVHAAGKC